jgi:hypothetical protein
MKTYLQVVMLFIIEKLALKTSILDTIITAETTV